MKTNGWAAYDAKSPLRAYAFERRALREDDVAIEITHCGVCHSDLHQARNEWGGSSYPMVPGHEIVGRVTAVGPKVTKMKVGDLAGVGCMADSCRTCSACKEGLEQYCERFPTMSYNGVDKDGTTTQGGYSTNYVVTQDFALKISGKLPLERIAPLLCAGITTWSPLKKWGVTKGSKVGVLGLGGLGHMAVKLANALGAEVSLLSSSAKKKDDATRLGAHDFLVHSDDAAMKNRARHFDLLLDTVSAPHDLAKFIELVKRDGAMVLLGAPDKPAVLPAFPLIMQRRAIAGSLIGGIAETQEMLDFCADHEIGADVEVIPAQQIDTAYERMLKSDVRYRFVVDANSLR